MDYPGLYGLSTSGFGYSATLSVATAMSETCPKADVQVKTTYEYTAQLNVDVFDESGVFLDEGEA